MAARSAGILMYRERADGHEVLLVHPGGPYWRNKDLGAWSIPKGEVAPGEDDETAARREFQEELGFPAQGPLIPLGEVRQAGGKRVVAFALAGDLAVSKVRSNRFEMEWPPRSGRRQTFPEVDRAAWFTLDAAHEQILDGQRPLLNRLAAFLRSA
ncbi:NUDIX domain-containing protein [Amorphus sp. 3PC139-8]|uniref:NUDIX domain-containing protein n=1 Tax=Amorphus sp. 3PC139-8 TaxID=2735676 RepID=UPI00345D7648